MVKGLDESVNKLRNDYYANTRKYMTNVFGDYMSPTYTAPEWKGPEAPDPLVSEFDDDDEE